MNMFGWTTWGRIDLSRVEGYEQIGPMRLYKHYAGMIVAVPESFGARDDVMLALASMNDHLEAIA